MIIEPSWRKGFPELILKDQTMPVAFGGDWNVALSGDRHCIGYHAFGSVDQTPCMRDRQLPEGKESQCEDCRMKDVSFAAKTGFGSSQQATELLNKDHAVYLALFSEDTIKVGVSVWERREIRTKEQGATACLCIAKGNGTVARNLERRIHTTLGLTEWVRMNTKLAALAQPIEEAEALSILSATYEKVKDRFGEAALISPEFMYHRASYGLDPATASLPINQITKISAGARFGGKVYGILGKSVLLMRDERLYAIDMNLLSGYSFIEPIDRSFSSEFAGVEVKTIEVDRQQSLLGLL